MSYKKQTALKELIKEMESLADRPYINPKNALADCIYLAYAKLNREEIQIQKAFVSAYLIGGNNIELSDARKSAEQYYNETYEH